ncbi:MAG: phenylalanine--tRNA ligase subunit beta [Bacteriovoracaceae bacterium]|nr:phenylalanine--tRNA ligase subunit beta [Bacteriovoracaceae bacterium]
MLISIDWIKDFVEIPKISPKEIGERFTLATAEVEDIISSGEYFEKVHVAHIESIRKHPEADKLNLVTLILNQKGDKIEVVCGAANVRVGLNICYAPTGTTLPGGLTLEPKKIRGFLSEGMICSDEELGFSDNSEGIIELPENAPVGQNLIEYMNQKKDVLLEVDNKSITHRPDLWGHYGMAREFSTIFGAPLKTPFDAKWMNKLRAEFSTEKSPVTPVVDTDSCCLGYYGLSLSGIKVADSPEWIKARLNSCGLRPINSIVDISNYVMLELGMPLHIFDRSKIAGDKLFIKRTGEGLDFITLDDQSRKLLPTDTVICDSDGPLVLGGIMGGLNSGVVADTSDLFIEVANWKAAEVRKTSTRLGLRTDSSQRYEKTLDSNLMERTLFRTLELIFELNPSAKVVGKLEYDGSDFKSVSPLTIKTNSSKIERILGKEIGHNRIVEIFSALDFNVEAKGCELLITVPTYRATKDIECEADLVEEIGRIVGYDNIVPTAPLAEVAPVRLSTAKLIERKTRDFMVYNASACEVMTYPLVGDKLLKKSQWPSLNGLKLLNALSEDADRMRPSLLPSILESIAVNNKNSDRFKIFEIGRAYFDDSKSFSREEDHLVIAYYDKEKSCYLELLNTVERLLGALNVPFDICDKNPKFKNVLAPDEWVGCHPHEYLNVRIMGKMHGAVISAHPILLKDYKVKGNLSLAVINLSAFNGRPLKDKTKYRPLPKFPSATFDCTVVANINEPVGNILDCLKKVKIKEFVDRKIVTVFDLGEGKKAVTIKSTFLDPSKTLDSELIKCAENTILATLDKNGYPLKS